MIEHPLIENAKPFLQLGNFLNDSELVRKRFDYIFEKQYDMNPWFIPLFCRRSLEHVAQLLKEDTLLHFLQHYVGGDLKWNQQKKVAVLSSSQYPFAGFAELLYILLSGNNVIFQEQGNDRLLMRTLVQWLVEIAPTFAERIIFSSRIKGFDAVIADSSDLRFETYKRYFKAVPHVIRRLRHTAAVLVGNESADELKALSEDIYLYFGMAPRSVSKLYVPRSYDFVPLLHTLHDESRCIAEHHQYLNHLDYQKAVRLMCSKYYMDAGTFIFVEEKIPKNEISVLNYTYYDQFPTVLDNANEVWESAHCGISFGNANRSNLFEYPDNIDVMLFLGTL